MTLSPIRFRHLGALCVVVAMMAMTMGVASSEPLKESHQGTVASCDGAVEWHFIHNQTDADNGVITVGTLQVANGAPFEASVLHYLVNTGNNVLPSDVADDVSGGALVLSHFTCLTTTTTTDPPGSSSTTTTTTTKDPPGSSSTTTTTTTKDPPGSSSTTTTTTKDPPASSSATTTTTTGAVVTQVLPAVEIAVEAGAVVTQPSFTG